VELYTEMAVEYPARISVVTEDIVKLSSVISQK